MIIKGSPGGDEVADCPLSEDENSCGWDVYFCYGGQGIDLDYMCDGELDCPNGDDEIDCPVFVCEGGEEIPDAWYCDGVVQCVNGDDEDC